MLAGGAEQEVTRWRSCAYRDGEVETCLEQHEFVLNASAPKEKPQHQAAAGC
jgi:hypothetical protein